MPRLNGIPPHRDIPGNEAGVTPAPFQKGISIMSHSPQDSNRDPAHDAAESLEDIFADFFPDHDESSRPIIDGDAIVITMQGIPTPDGEFHWQYSITFPVRPGQFDKPIRFNSMTFHDSRPLLIAALKEIYAFLVKIKAVSL